MLESEVEMPPRTLKLRKLAKMRSLPLFGNRSCRSDRPRRREAHDGMATKCDTRKHSAQRALRPPELFGLTVAGFELIRLEPGLIFL